MMYFVRVFNHGELVAKTFVNAISEDDAKDGADFILAMNDPDLKYDDMDAIEADEPYIEF